jgi:hypothetical protein
MNSDIQELENLNQELDELYKSNADLQTIESKERSIRQKERSIEQKQEERSARQKNMTSDDMISIEQSLWWFQQQGDAEDLLKIVNLEQQLSLFPDSLPIYHDNPALKELLQDAKTTIILKIVQQSSSEIHRLAEELFVDRNSIADWFLTSKNFLNGKTPFACLKDPEGIKLIERQIRQSIAGVCA